MTKYISMEDAIKVAEKYGTTNGSALGTHSGVADCIAAEIYRLPDYAVVNRTAYDQATFERDTALQQLKSIGKGLGERMDDVAPVVDGQWIIGVDNDDFDVKCSKCEWTDIFEVAGIATVGRITKAMHYCPNCGAKMDGGVNNGD